MSIPRSILRRFGGAVLLLCLFITGPAFAAVVNSTADNGPGSLRDALSAASSGDTISFSLPTPSTITLTTGELSITKSVTIAGPGANALLITNAGGRVFNLDTSAKTVVISGVHLTGQNRTGDGGAIINNGGNLTLQYVLIDNSISSGEGGAIRNNFNGSTDYSLTIQNSTITGNSASKEGAIYFIGCNLTIENSTIYANHATDSSGAIGLFYGCGYIYNSTIVGNTANTVGGITSLSSALTIESSIIANNTDTITGINDLNRTGGGNSFVYATNSLFSETFLVGDNVLNGTDTGNLTGTDPQLGGLASNGGPTQTLLPATGSPAIGAGSNSQNFAYDQRGPGFPRNANSMGGAGSVDIGAVQSYIFTPKPPAPTPALNLWGLLALAISIMLLSSARRKTKMQAG